MPLRLIPTRATVTPLINVTVTRRTRPPMFTLGVPMLRSQREAQSLDEGPNRSTPFR